MISRYRVLQFLGTLVPGLIMSSNVPPIGVSTPSSDDIEPDTVSGPDTQPATTFSLFLTSATLDRLSHAFGLANRLVKLNANIGAPLAQIYIQKAIDLLTGIDAAQNTVI